MEQFDGAVTELGDAVVNVARTGSITIYSYVNVGSKILRKLKVCSGVDGKLKTALSTGEQVTLFTKHDFLVGVKLANGQTFGSDFGVGIGFYLGFIVSLVVGAMLSLIIIGLPLLWVAWREWQVIAAKSAAASLPNVVLI